MEHSSGAVSEWKLRTVDPQERRTWISGVRSAMHAASQLPGRGPTYVDDAPALARYQKSDFDMEGGTCLNCLPQTSPLHSEQF